MTTISTSQPSTPEIDICKVINEALKDSIRDRQFDPKKSKPFGDAIILHQQNHLSVLQRRLEWFGDKVLNFLVGQLMKPVFPRAPVATLKGVHSALKSNACFGEIAFKIGISQTSIGKAPADVLEAYANNVFVAFGMPFTREWVRVLFQPLVELSHEVCERNGVVTEDPKFEEDPKDALGFYQRFGADRYNKLMATLGCVNKPEYLVVSSFKLPEPKELGFTEGTVVRLESNLVRIWLPVFRKHMNVSIEHPCIYRATFEGSRLHVDWWPSEDERSCNSKLVQESYCLRGQMNVDVQECKLPNGGTYLRASLSHPLEIEA